MKSITIILINLISFRSFAQVGTGEIKKFGQSVNDRAKLDQTVLVTASTFMYQAYPQHSPLEIDADIEKLTTNSVVFENFAYHIVLSYGGNRELSGQMLYRLCGDANLAIRISEYIRGKYKSRLENDMAAEKIREQQQIATLQKEIDKKTQEEDSLEKKAEEEKIAKEKYERENKHALFAGGSWVAFLNRNLKYPASEIRDPLPEGEVVAAFVIRIDGTVDSVRIVSSNLGNAFKNEVIRVLKLSKWTPAIKNNQPAEEEQTLPFKFGSQE